MSRVTTSLVITMESSERVSNQRFLIYLFFLFIYLFILHLRQKLLVVSMFVHYNWF